MRERGSKLDRGRQPDRQRESLPMRERGSKPSWAEFDTRLEAVMNLTCGCGGTDCEPPGWVESGCTARTARMSAPPPAADVEASPLGPSAMAWSSRNGISAFSGATAKRRRSHIEIPQVAIEFQIAAATPRLAGLMLGAAGMAADLG